MEHLVAIRTTGIWLGCALEPFQSEGHFEAVAVIDRKSGPRQSFGQEWVSRNGIGSQMVLGDNQELLVNW